MPVSAFAGVVQPAVLPPSIHELASVSCFSTRRCVAVGTSVTGTAAVATTTNGGTNWATGIVPPGPTALTSVSCSDQRHCAAGGVDATTGAIVSSDDGGTSWTLAALPPGVDAVTAMTCLPSRSCRAIAVLSGRATALASTGSGAGASWDATWTTEGPLPTDLSSVTGLSCPDANDCWAAGSVATDSIHAGGGGATTADGGATWTPWSLPSTVGPLRDVWCGPLADPTSSTGTAAGQFACTAVGTSNTLVSEARAGRGMFVTSVDSGKTWHVQLAPMATADLLAVTCAGGACIAVGTTLATTAKAGVLVLAARRGLVADTWTKAAELSVALPLKGVDCATTVRCVAVGLGTTVTVGTSG